MRRSCGKNEERERKPFRKGGGRAYAHRSRRPHPAAAAGKGAHDRPARRAGGDLAQHDQSGGTGQGAPLPADARAHHGRARRLPRRVFSDGAFPLRAGKWASPCQRSSVLQAKA